MLGGLNKYGVRSEETGENKGRDMPGHAAMGGSTALKGCRCGRASPRAASAHEAGFRPVATAPERTQNTQNHPGLFPGLCVAILGFLPSFERFLFMAVSTAAPKTIDNSIGLQVEMRSTP